MVLFRLLNVILLASAIRSLPTNQVCPARPDRNCQSCESIDPLRIMTLNTWGLSWFEEHPIPSPDEPYNITKVVDAMKTFAAKFPNPLLGLLDYIPATQLIGALNPSLKKKARFQAICDFLKREKFDAVFLQEVWFEKDYNFLANCTKPDYFISAYDKEFCGAADKMIGLNCSGLVTLSKHKLKGQRYVKLDLGDGTKAPLLDLYITHFSNKKVLYTDITIKRNIQIGQLIDGLGCGYDHAVVGMDMNDSPLIVPEPQPYGKMYNAGFQDAANPNPKTNEDIINRIYLSTYGNAINTWSGAGTDEMTVTLDYIMAKSELHLSKNSYVDVRDFKVVDLKTSDNLSFSDHSAVMATIKTRCSKQPPN